MRLCVFFGCAVRRLQIQASQYNGAMFFTDAVFCDFGRLCSITRIYMS